MSAPVVRLPTATPSYVRVRRYGRRWCIQLVTPCERGKPLTTTLGSIASRDGAIDYARHVAGQMRRPVRLPGERAP